jgi:hypothetical protein
MTKEQNMTRDDIIRMAEEAGFQTDLQDVWITYDGIWSEEFERFAALVAAEKEQQMIRDGYRKCAEGQRTTQFCGLLEEAVKAEREACAEVCEKLPETFKIAADEFGYQAETPTAENYAAAIRTRNDE